MDALEELRVGDLACLGPLKHRAGLARNRGTFPPGPAPVPAGAEGPGPLVGVEVGTGVLPGEKWGWNCQPRRRESAVPWFLSRLESLVTGALSSRDRLVSRGTRMLLMNRRGVHTHLLETGIRLLDHEDHALTTSAAVKAAARAEQGPICALTAVDPWRPFAYLRSKDTNAPGLRLANRLCLRVYPYSIHPRFDIIDARLQIWFPFSIQICCMTERGPLDRSRRRGSALAVTTTALPTSTTSHAPTSSSRTS